MSARHSPSKAGVAGGTGGEGPPSALIAIRKRLPARAPGGNCAQAVSRCVTHIVVEVALVVAPVQGARAGCGGSRATGQEDGEVEGLCKGGKGGKSVEIRVAVVAATAWVDSRPAAQRQWVAGAWRGWASRASERVRQPAQGVAQGAGAGAGAASPPAGDRRRVGCCRLPGHSDIRPPPASDRAGRIGPGAGGLTFILASECGGGWVGGGDVLLRGRRRLEKMRGRADQCRGLPKSEEVSSGVPQAHLKPWVHGGTRASALITHPAAAQLSTCH